MLPQNIQKGKLIEQYQGETNIMSIARDDVMWAAMQLELVDFCTRLHGAMNQK